MIFERYEMEQILKNLVGNKILYSKVEQVLNSKKEGRFTFHCTEKNKEKKEAIGDLLK